jgi:lipoprotein-anchoring transpeptidase ErfK/SrfK
MRMKLGSWAVILTGVIGLGVVGGAMIAAEPVKTAPLISVNASLVAAPVVSAAKVPVQPVTTPAAPVDDRFIIKRILPITGPIRYGEWHWDDAGVPAGPLVVTVDLEARVLSVFRGGYEIGATAVLLGTQEKPTPTGVFPITMKDAKHFSSTYDNAPMPFTMRLTNDGVSIHGTTVERGYASHGCVGVPTPFAEKLFAIAKLGDRVIITRGKTATMGDALITL